jgi:hypothetical protein
MTREIRNRRAGDDVLRPKTATVEIFKHRCPRCHRCDYDLSMTAQHVGEMLARPNERETNEQ